ncbi:MAG: dodecin domain-containing protein [Rhodospirillaceae bacterium]|nr:dodecin domain-containing protein [Rhodospirillaceae bacterium]
MALMKVIEVLAESPTSWEEAAQSAVDEASRTLRGIRSIYIKEFEAKVEDDRVTRFRVNAKITFEVEGSRAETEGTGARRARAQASGRSTRRRR